MSDLPQSTYPEDPRDDIRPHLPERAASILDVGCGRGGFGPTLRAAYGPDARIVGVEAVAASAATARAGHGFDEVVEGFFPAALTSGERFDLICFNDVLEHLLEPDAVLEAARERLTPSGRVLAAIPNITYIPTTVDLLKGRWDYTDDGLLDRTHVRFFTRSTMLEMFARTGFHVDVCQGMNSIWDKWRTDPNILRRHAKRVAARALSHRQFLHFLVVASPARVEP